MGGGKGGSNTGDRGAERLENITAELYGQTQPYRDYFQNTFQDASRGDIDWSRTGYGAMRDSLEGQYGAARQQILEGTARGGGQTVALGNLARDRARNVGALRAKILEDLLNKGYGAAYGVPQTSVSGLSSVAAAESQRYAAEQAAQGGKGQALGMAGGMVGSAYLNKGK